MQLAAQMLGVPAYFLLSRDATLGHIPPLPITLDKEWARRKDIHYILSQLVDGVDKSTYLRLISGLSDNDKLKLKPFIEMVKIEHTTYVSLSALGMALWYSIRRNTEVVLSDRTGDLIFQSSQSEAHSQEGIKHHRIKQIFEKIPFVSHVRVMKYSQHEKGRKPKVTPVSQIGVFHVEVPMGSDGILHLEVSTTASDEREHEKAREELKAYLEELL